MNLIPVVSNNIAALGFKEGNQIALGTKPVNILYVQFIHGAVYAYYGVAKEMYEEFLKAESKGKFFHANIGTKYEFEIIKKGDKNESN